MKHILLTGLLLLGACAVAPQKQLTPPPSTPVTRQLSSAACGVKLDKYLEMGFARFD